MTRKDKTRNRLLEIARQTFIKKGVEHTTMNDIAEASGNVRRTLYTHFKSKEDIYWAVVEREIMHLVSQLKGVVDNDLPPAEKLYLYIDTRLKLVKEIVQRNGSLRAEFFRDIWKVEHAWKNIDQEEIILIKTILQEGVDKGVFTMPNVRTTAVLIHYSLRGIDLPYIRNQFQRIGIELSNVCKIYSDTIINGIMVEKTDNV